MATKLLSCTVSTKKGIFISLEKLIDRLRIINFTNICAVGTVSSTIAMNVLDLSHARQHSRPQTTARSQTVDVNCNCVGDAQLTSNARSHKTCQSLFCLKSWVDLRCFALRPNAFSPCSSGSIR